MTSQDVLIGREWLKSQFKGAAHHLPCMFCLSVCFKIPTQNTKLKGTEAPTHCVILIASFMYSTLSLVKNTDVFFFCFFFLYYFLLLLLLVVVVVVAVVVVEVLLLLLPLMMMFMLLPSVFEQEIGK